MPRLKSACSIASLLLALATASAAHAAYTVVFTQMGNAVFASGTGSLDTASLTKGSNVGGIAPLVDPGASTVQVGDVTTLATVYSGPVTGPSLGSANTTFANSGTGNVVALLAGQDGQVVDLPYGYVSGADLGTSTASYPNATFTSLGLTPGVYLYSIGTGPDADTFTLDIVVPEPASLGLLALGSLGLLSRRRRA